MKHCDEHYISLCYIYLLMAPHERVEKIVLLCVSLFATCNFYYQDNENRHELRVFIIYARKHYNDSYKIKNKIIDIYLFIIKGRKKANN